MKKIIYLFCLTINLFSCNNETEKTSFHGLELTLMNGSINAYVSKDTLHHRILISNEKYMEKARTIISYKIENKSQRTYILNKNKPSFSGLYASDVEIRDNLEDIKLESNTVLGSFMSDNKYDFEKLNEKLLNIHYKNLLDTEINNFYRSKQNKNNCEEEMIELNSIFLDEFIKTNENYKNNSFKLYPGEIKYFKTYLFLPNIFDLTNGNESNFYFNYSKKYNLKLNLSFGIEKREKQFLSNTEIKNIEENNFKIFNGELTSKNAVPIKFIN